MEVEPGVSRVDMEKAEDGLTGGLCAADAALLLIKVSETLRDRMRLLYLILVFCPPFSVQECESEEPDIPELPPALLSVPPPENTPILPALVRVCPLPKSPGNEPTVDVEAADADADETADVGEAEDDCDKPAPPLDVAVLLAARPSFPSPEAGAEVELR